MRLNIEPSGDCMIYDLGVSALTTTVGLSQTLHIGFYVHAFSPFKLGEWFCTVVLHYKIKCKTILRVGHFWKCAGLNRFDAYGVECYASSANIGSDCHKIVLAT